MQQPFFENYKKRLGFSNYLPGLLKKPKKTPNFHITFLTEFDLFSLLPRFLAHCFWLIYGHAEST